MTFLELQARLVAAVRERIQNGEITERAFARRVGVSQPHIHHVLKGTRALSPQFCDRILAELGVSVFDLAAEGTPAAPVSGTRSPKRPPGKSPGPVPRSAAS